MDRRAVAGGFFVGTFFVWSMAILPTGICLQDVDS